MHYFLRDAEELPPGGGNILLRNSELAVTLWIAYHRLFDKHGEARWSSIIARLRSFGAGFQVMQANLRELAEYARRNNIRIYLAMTPDVHNLVDYKFGFVHDIMREIAETTATRTSICCRRCLAARRRLWAMPGDPHPNAFGHD